MNRFLKVAAQALIALLPLAPALADDQLRIVSFGGVYQSAERKTYYEPFAKETGIKIIEDEYNGEIAKVRAMVKSKTVTWDVAHADAGQAAEMCAEGIIEVIDWKRLGLDRSKFTDQEKNDCGVPNNAYGYIIAWDKDKLPNGPATMADFFDLRKFPGKRAIQKTPWGIIEWALVADGVAVKDVYKVLRTREGVDQAFKKLDTIKKDVVWFTTNAQGPQLLADGQVVMVTATSGRILEAIKNSGKHFEMMWDAPLVSTTLWTIPKGTSHQDEAYKFISFAASPARQAGLTQYINYGPTNKDAIPLVDPGVLRNLATSPEHMQNALLIDPSFWTDNGEELRQRFTAWVSK
ncbi:putative spermidine/putrescine transport system substrate-binding protein [Bradyrhizobium sp. F1.4.3]|uniref:ABC transporter substrate-binding protein n=1 Tax=Bradyrhizobium sp. F1.4.3 TaxID=3156356 RepID=UPI0033907952